MCARISNSSGRVKTVSPWLIQTRSTGRPISRTPSVSLGESSSLRLAGLPERMMPPRFMTESKVLISSTVASHGRISE